MDLSLNVKENSTPNYLCLKTGFLCWMTSPVVLGLGISGWPISDHCHVFKGTRMWWSTTGPNGLCLLISRFTMLACGFVDTSSTPAVMFRVSVAGMTSPSHVARARTTEFLGFVQPLGGGVTPHLNDLCFTSICPSPYIVSRPLHSILEATIRFAMTFKVLTVVPSRNMY